MNLQKLCEASHVTIYFDSWNNWLYLDWHGELTMPAVQRACLDIARCYLAHPSPRVLNSNTQVTHIDWQVPAWLAQQFLPVLRLVGVEQLVWVYGPTLRARDMVHETLSRFPSPGIMLFGDMEDAVAWLQQTHPSYYAKGALPPRSPAASSNLAALLDTLTRQVQPECLPA